MEDTRSINDVITLVAEAHASLKKSLFLWRAPEHQADRERHMRNAIRTMQQATDEAERLLAKQPVGAEA